MKVNENASETEMLAMRVYKAADKIGIPLVCLPSPSSLYISHATLDREPNECEWQFLRSLVASEARKLGVTVRESVPGMFRLSR